MTTATSLTGQAVKRALTAINAEPSDTPAELEGLLLDALEDLVTLARVLWTDDEPPVDFTPKSPDELLRLAIRTDDRRVVLDERGWNGGPL